MIHLATFFMVGNRHISSDWFQAKMMIIMLYVNVCIVDISLYGGVLRSSFIINVISLSTEFMY